MIKYLLVISFLCFHTTVLYAQVSQQTVSPPTEVFDEDNDNDNVEKTNDVFVDTFLYNHPVSISPDSIIAWKNKKQFNYMKNLDSLLKASQVKEKQPEYKPSFIEMLFRSNIFALLAWLLCGFVVVLIIYQLVKTRGLFSGNSRKKGVEEYFADEHVELTHDFDQLIHQAYKMGDFRMAVRYEFLRTLKYLRKSGHIEFAIDKTNSMYLKEVPAEWCSEFRSLIHDYEYVWYGHFDIDKDKYALIQKKFASFARHIS